MTDTVTRAPVALEHCSVARALALIGDGWTLLILREAFYGVSRFEAMQADLNIPRSILSQRLRSLVERGIMERTAYQATGQRRRWAYDLTEKGRALLPTLVALMEWGDHFAIADAPPAIKLFHHNCGAAVHSGLTCAHGHQITDVAELRGELAEAAAAADHGPRTTDHNVVP